MWRFLAGGGKGQVGEGKRKRYLCCWLGEEWHNTGQIVLNIPKLHLHDSYFLTGGGKVPPGPVLPPLTKPLHWEHYPAPSLPSPSGAYAPHMLGMLDLYCFNITLFLQN